MLKVSFKEEIISDEISDFLLLATTPPPRTHALTDLCTHLPMYLSTYLPQYTGPGSIPEKDLILIPGTSKSQSDEGLRVFFSMLLTSYFMWSCVLDSSNFLLPYLLMPLA